MQKQKFLKLLLIFPVLSLLMLAKPASADFLGIGEALQGALMNAVASLFGWVANIISNLLFGQLLNPILNLVKADSNLLLNHDIAQSIWTGALIVANGLFLLALVLASVAIILRLNTGMYNLKKVLGGFIMAVILSNLSLLIVRVLVEFGDNLYIAAFNLFNSIDSRLTYDIVNGPDGFISALTKIKAPPAGGADAEAHLGAVLLAIIMMVLVFWILLKLTLILLERMFWIFLLAISAPIIFALGLLPTTQKLAADWWNKLIKWILVLPLVAVILNIAIYFLILTAEDPDNPSATINPAEFISKLTGTDFFKELLSGGGKGIFLIVGLIILYQAGRASNLLGIGQGGLSGAVDTPKKMGGTVKSISKPVGKAISKGGRHAYNLGMGTKPGQRLEGWRQSQKGTLGKIFNPKKERERIEVNRGIAVENAKQEALLQRISVNKKRLEANPDNKKLEKSIKDDMSSAEYHINKSIKDLGIETLGPADVLAKEASDSSGTFSNRAQAIQKIRKISRSRNRPQAERDFAREWLAKNALTIENAGLDYNKYKPPAMIPTTDIAPGATKSTDDVELIKARQILLAQITKLKSAPIGSAIDRLKISGHLNNLINNSKMLNSVTQNKTSLDSMSTTDRTSVLGGISLAKTKGVDIISKLSEMRRTGKSDVDMMKELRKVDIKDVSEQKALINLAKEGMDTDDIKARIDILDYADTKGIPIEQVLNKIKPDLEQANRARNTVRNIKMNQSQQNEKSGISYEITLRNTVTKEAGARGVSVNVIKSEVKTNSKSHIDKITVALQSKEGVNSKTKVKDLIGNTDADKLKSELEKYGFLTGDTGKMEAGQILEKLRLINRNVDKV